MNTLPYPLLLVLIGVASGTRINFNNRCNYPVQLIGTENGEDPMLAAMLQSGQRSGVDIWENGMSYKNGWTGRSLAQFAIGSWNAQDVYDLSVTNGFDTPMQIATDKGGPTVTCWSAGCPDAYLYKRDQNKSHAVPTAGIFTLIFCPDF